MIRQINKVTNATSGDGFPSGIELVEDDEVIETLWYQGQVERDNALSVIEKNPDETFEHYHMKQRTGEEAMKTFKPDYRRDEVVSTFKAIPRVVPKTLTVHDMSEQMRDLLYANRANDPVVVYNLQTGERHRIVIVDVDIKGTIELNVVPM